MFLFFSVFPFFFTFLEFVQRQLETYSFARKKQCYKGAKYLKELIDFRKN